MIKGKKSIDSCYFDHKQFLKLHDRVHDKLNQSQAFKKQKTGSVSQSQHGHSLPSVPSARSNEKGTNVFMPQIKAVDQAYGNLMDQKAMQRSHHSISVGKNLNSAPLNEKTISGWTNNQKTQYLDIPNINQNKQLSSIK